MLKRISALLLVILVILPAMLPLHAEPLEDDFEIPDQTWTSPLAVIILIVMIALAAVMGYFKIKSIMQRDKKYSRTYRDHRDRL